MEWIFVKMLLSLGAVLALMFGLVYLLRRFVLIGGAAPGQAVAIEVLGRKALQPKRSVVVLNVAGRVLVVGMSEQGMQLLTELPDAVAAPMTGQDAAPAAPATGFGALLQAKLNTMVNRKLEKRSV